MVATNVLRFGAFVNFGVLSQDASMVDLPPVSQDDGTHPAMVEVPIGEPVMMQEPGVDPLMGLPAQEMPPSYEQPMEMPPVHEQPADTEVPAQEMPQVYEQPVEQPVDMQFAYSELPAQEMPPVYQQPVDMQFAQMPPVYEQPVEQFQFASPEVQAAEPWVEKSVEALGLKPFTEDQIVCAQAQSGLWWNAKVFHDNQDYTYFLLVQDEVHTQWPRVHWADIIDSSCSDFYQGGLDGPQYGKEDAGQDNLVQQRQQQFQQALQSGQSLQPGQQPSSPGKWPAGKPKKQIPWALLSGAAVAGSVPILYHMSGASGPAA